MTTLPIGEQLQTWRRRRHLSQLALASEAEVSQRHLSFIESGRAVPSREMVLHLAHALDIPTRARNGLLLAAGYAPLYRERALDDPDLDAARQAVARILQGHEPHPALAVDRHWQLVLANRAVAPLLEGVDAALLEAPVNVLRLSLHPQGLGPKLVNYGAWRAHVLERLARQIEHSADTVLAALRAEIQAYPAPADAATSGPDETLGGIAVPFALRTRHGVLAFLSTTTVFGTAVDISLSELTIESFFPADAATAAVMRKLLDADRAAT
jgi:transcriptional regulator with XRE-family HTH domain